MAAYVEQTSKHVTAGVATVDSVLLSQFGKSIQILHRGTATNPLYVTIGNVVAPTAINGTPDPTVAGDDTLVVMAGTAGNPLVVNWPASSGSTACVKVICAAAEPYSVQVVNEPYGS